MTRLVDDPEMFTADSLEGFVAAHRDDVRRVPGGVVRADRLTSPRVAVVVGGGSGHYPAFAGLVGPGMATGAVCGNVFTSPSSDDAVTVARAAHEGLGVLFLFGNYAGDVLHFGEAASRLHSSGIDARIVLCTDDIASAPPERREDRRGVAGDFVVFKIAGAAAAAGIALDDVERVAAKANALTFTLGAAFAGCTLPGASAPLFRLPDGTMSIGLGIHGEPGIADQQRVPAAELADILVARLLAEAPRGARRAAVVLNGLGSVKHEELFVLYRHVDRLLTAGGVTVVEPEVGEFVTSLDMAGVSLTLCWLDEELETLWRAPADSPGYRKRRRSEGLVERETVDLGQADGTSSDGDGVDRFTPLTEESLARVSRALRSAEAELGRLDAIAGDGDHGVGMSRGADAAVAAARALRDRASGASLLIAAGRAWSGRAGGTSGALWGAAIQAMGDALRTAGSREDAVLVVSLAHAALDSIVSLGHAAVGDKTMVDALAPFVAALDAELAAGRSVADALSSAAAAAERAAAATAALTPRLGRARPLAQRSVGHPDPGATSMAIIARALANREEGR